MDEVLRMTRRRVWSPSSSLKCESFCPSYRFAANEQGFPIHPETGRDVYGYAYIVRGWQFIPELCHAAGRESSQEEIESHTDRQGIPLELTVNVLTASYWPQPIVASTPCTFSDQLSPAMSMFQKYYDSRHNGRRLTWQGSLGTADVKVRFKARSHDLNVSTHALVVLLLFEDVSGEDSLSYAVSCLACIRQISAEHVGYQVSYGSTRFRLAANTTISRLWKV